jgi:hypothetical protein
MYTSDSCERSNFGHRSFTVNSQRFLAQDNLGPTLPCPYALVSPMQYANNQIPLVSRGFTIFFKETTLNNGVTGLFVYYNRLAFSIPSLRCDFNTVYGYVWDSKGNSTIVHLKVTVVSSGKTKTCVTLRKSVVITSKECHLQIIKWSTSSSISQWLVVAMTPHWLHQLPRVSMNSIWWSVQNFRLTTMQ